MKEVILFTGLIYIAPVILALILFLYSSIHDVKVDRDY